MYILSKNGEDTEYKNFAALAMEVIDLADVADKFAELESELDAPFIDEDAYLLWVEHNMEEVLEECGYTVTRVE